MRIQPLLSRYSKNLRNNIAQTKFERNSTAIPAHRANHEYTGNWSADLAYASLVDSNIANDLRSMGLIV